MAGDLWPPELFCRKKVFFLLEFRIEVGSMPDVVTFLPTATSMAHVQSFVTQDE